MKRKSSLGLFSGLALGLGSIYALAVYFNLTADELKGFMLSTAMLLVAMFILAALLVGLIKLSASLLRRFGSRNHVDGDDDQQ
jgi:hypothetical protein